mgnify:FL=1
MVKIIDDAPSQARAVLGTPTGTRGYRTPADRNRAIAMLVRRGLNHFVCYRDVQSEFALQFCVAAWAGSHPYICR